MKSRLKNKKLFIFKPLILTQQRQFFTDEKNYFEYNTRIIGYALRTDKLSLKLEFLD